jgi:hypothetical protein
LPQRSKPDQPSVTKKIIKHPLILDLIEVFKEGKLEEEDIYIYLQLQEVNASNLLHVFG